MSVATAVFYTDAHRITGTLHLRERLSEALNDPLTDYLELQDVQISKLVDPSHRAVRSPDRAMRRKSPHGSRNCDSLRPGLPIRRATTFPCRPGTGRYRQSSG